MKKTLKVSEENLLDMKNKLSDAAQYKINVRNKLHFYIWCCSVAKLCPTLCNAVDCSMPGFLVLNYLPEFVKPMSIELMLPSKHLILCRLLLLLPLSSSIRVFSNESVLCIRRPKYWSFSFSISPSNEYSGLISFRIAWFDLAVQGTLNSLL